MKKIAIPALIFIVLISLAYAIVPDDDIDGVPNPSDKCADSFSDIVDIYGCSCEQKIDCDNSWCCKEDKGEFCEAYKLRATCMKDSDNDTVFDIEDRCPSTAAGAKIDEFGCSCSQKKCDDGNSCTDNTCNEEVECIFASDNENSCGADKKCDNGICTGENTAASQKINAPSYTYDETNGVLIISYRHSQHIIEVIFGKPPSDTVTIESTSNIISQEWNEDKTKLTLVVEGEASVEGITKINTMEKPVLVIMDKKEIEELKENLSPKQGFNWLYLSGFTVVAIILLGLIFSMNKHEEKMVSSIEKHEKKIEREQYMQGELQLMTYISSNLRRGYTAQQLRNQLLINGWKKETVDRAFQNLVIRR